MEVERQFDRRQTLEIMRTVLHNSVDAYIDAMIQQDVLKTNDKSNFIISNNQEIIELLSKITEIKPN